jgi:transcriptional repressor NrdR
MRCPACKLIDKDRVIDSRLTEGGGVVRRRRECTSCGRRFTTKERVEAELRLVVVKRGGDREPYDREKIAHGLRHACYKLPVDDEAIKQLIDGIEGDVFENHDREVTSSDIGEYVVRRLREINAVAYVRFMSVYRQYHDVAEFIEEIRSVKDFVAHRDPGQELLFEQ